LKNYALAICISFVLLGCKSTFDEGKAPLSGDSDVYAEPLIKQLRSHTNFQIVYLEDDGLSVPKENANLGPWKESYRTGKYEMPVIQGIIQDQKWIETTTDWPKHNQSLAVDIAHMADFPSDYINKTITTSAMYNGFTIGVHPATGGGADFHGEMVYNLWIYSRQMNETDGTLSPSVLISTKKPNDAGPEVLGGVPDALPGNRLVVGYGFRLSHGTFKTMWLYTAPYNATTKRLEINDVNDIIIYVREPSHKMGQDALTAPQMVIRTWDLYQYVEPLKRTFVTGLSMTSSGNGKNVIRLGIQYATIY
jgi:hypothetical protein